MGVRPVYKRVDTLRGLSSPQTAYMYLVLRERRRRARSRTYRQEKIMVLAAARTASVKVLSSTTAAHAVWRPMREDGYETIMVNCNPETVSTDYDTSDRLYFEPVTLEDVLEIVDKSKAVGVIVQYGGQTPLKLALDLEANACPSSVPRPDSIDIAEDRERFQKPCCTSWPEAAANRTARC